MTLVDFIVAELSNHFEKIYPEEYKNYPSLQRIRDNFNNLPEIKEYYDSPNAIKGPFLPPAYSVIKFWNWSSTIFIFSKFMQLFEFIDFKIYYFVGLIHQIALKK